MSLVSLLNTKRVLSHTNRLPHMPWNGDAVKNATLFRVGQSWVSSLLNVNQVYMWNDQILLKPDIKSSTWQVKAVSWSGCRVLLVPGYLKQKQTESKCPLQLGVDFKEVALPWHLVLFRPYFLQVLVYMDSELNIAVPHRYCLYCSHKYSKGFFFISAFERDFIV